MFKFCRGLIVFAALFSFSMVYAQEDVDGDQKTEKFNMDALRQWIRDKRLVTVKELGGDLSVSGEARTEFQTTHETRNGVKQRGSDKLRPAQAWDVEFNLMLDYRSERAWASIRVEFDNDMGRESGTTDNINLEKCYLGGRIVAGDTFTFDSELGRRFLGTVFDSKIEFGSLFDGGLVRFNKAFPSLGDFYTTVGGIIVNEKKDFYAGAAEVGLLRIGNTGFFAKASYIDWKKYNRNSVNNQRFNFRVTQLQGGYQFYPWKKLIKFYAAGLYNDAAKKLPLTNFKKLNGAWYAGVSIGQVRKQWDWAIDTNFQWVQAQAIPDFDASGIGRGNAGKVGFYTTNVDGTGDPTTNKTAVGRGNYYGFLFDLLFAFTNNLTLFQSFQWSKTLDTNVGPRLNYRQYEAEFIFMF